MNKKAGVLKLNIFILLLIIFSLVSIKEVFSADCQPAQSNECMDLCGVVIPLNPWFKKGDNCYKDSYCTPGNICGGEMNCMLDQGGICEDSCNAQTNYIGLDDDKCYGNIFGPNCQDLCCKAVPGDSCDSICGIGGKWYKSGNTCYSTSSCTDACTLAGSGSCSCTLDTVPYTGQCIESDAPPRCSPGFIPSCDQTGPDCGTCTCIQSPVCPCDDADRDGYCNGVAEAGGGNPPIWNCPSSYLTMPSCEAENFIGTGDCIDTDSACEYYYNSDTEDLCKDSKGLIFPDATEICDNDIDDDCDSQIDCSDPECANDYYCTGSVTGRCPGPGTYSWGATCYNSEYCAYDLPGKCEEDPSLIDCQYNVDPMESVPDGYYNNCNEFFEDYPYDCTTCMQGDGYAYGETNYGPCISRDTCHFSCENAGESCSSGGDCGDCLETNWPDCGPNWINSIPGARCAADTVCFEGYCQEYVCQFGENITNTCFCNGEKTEPGQYCCLGYTSDQPCSETMLLKYKWYPEEQNESYCGGGFIEYLKDWFFYPPITQFFNPGTWELLYHPESYCPQENPFRWNENYSSSSTFLESDNLNIFSENFPLFNEEYSLCEYFPYLCDYMKQEENSDNLSDYLLFIVPYLGADFVDEYFCPQQNGLIGEIPAIEIYDGGMPAGHHHGDILEVYCQDNVIRLCLSYDSTGDNCPWRDEPSSSESTCGIRNDGEQYNKDWDSWDAGTMVKPDSDYTDSQINLAELVGTGDYLISQIYCRLGPVTNGYSPGWRQYEGAISNFFTHKFYPNNTGIATTVTKFGITSSEAPPLGYSNLGNRSIIICDPDADSNQCTECELGYNLSNEEKDLKDRYWDYASEECAGDDYYRLGIVKPDFLWAHVDDADFSETFCTQGPIGVNYSNPSLRDWDSDAFCCGDDDGTWYQDRNTQGGPEEPLSIDINNGLSNYHDCAKTVNVQEGTEEKQILCNYQKSSAGSIWYDSSEKIGEITALPCFKQVGGYQNENIELLSDGEEWFMCIEQDVPPPQTQTHQFRGQTFTEEKTVTDSTTGTDISHSYFCNPASDSENKSIYECQGSFTPPFSTESAGQTYSTGKNISYEQQVYYCAKETKDSPIEYSESSTLWTTDLDYTNAETCNIGVGTNRWTGKNLLHYYDTTTDFCCGEHEDIQELTNPGKEFSLYESYNDIGGLAACFNGTPQLNKNFVEGYDELYIIEGEIQGCAIDRNHAKGLIHPFPDKQYKDNDHLLELLDWPNPAQENQPREDALLINDRQYCEIINGTEEYFCSYKEVWNTTGGLNLNHLSIIPQEFWENDTYPQNAECCEPTQCWDSTQCIEQQLNPSSEPYFGNYRCINGTWAVSDLKYDWDNHMSGYCFSQTQCLVNPSGEYGNPDNPICIESDEFIGDHYCENGNWTTRTKYLALELLDLTKTTNQNLYTIYCDDYTNTLNNINYIQQPSGMNIIDFILVQRFTKGYTFNSVNNFCILNTENNIILATSLNHPIELEDYSNFINVFEHTGETSLPESDEGYQLIQNSNYIYYNNQTNSIIYSKQQLNFQEYDTNLLDFFQNLFQYITNFFTPGGFTSTYDFINQTKDFNQLYISNEKQVVAIREKVTPTQEHLSISYAGTGADICESVEKYDDYISTTDSIQCNETRGITYIASSLPEGINVWSQITKKLRPQQAS